MRESEKLEARSEKGLLGGLLRYVPHENNRKNLVINLQRDYSG
jgi:hypothetical protein